MCGQNMQKYQVYIDFEGEKKNYGFYKNGHCQIENYSEEQNNTARQSFNYLECDIICEYIKDIDKKLVKYGCICEAISKHLKSKTIIEIKMKFYKRIDLHIAVRK